MEDKKGLKYFLKITLTLVAIAAVMAFALAAVNAATKARIDENSVKEMNDVISRIFGEGITSTELKFTPSDPVDAVYSIETGGEFAGWAVKCSPMGFKDEIEMIVGVNADGTCKSVRIISLSETPGLGAKVQEDSFLDQFGGASGNLEVKVNVQEVAGATISSRAVTRAVNAALEAVGQLGGEKK